MAWTRLTNSTTADADEVHADFVEIRSGSLLPMKLSTSASTTDGAYDLGSATYRWANVHAKNIYKLLTVSSALADTATAINITGLNNNLFEEYEISMFARINFNGPGNNINLIFNGDTSTAYGYFWGLIYTTTSIFTTQQSMIVGLAQGANTICKIRLHLFAKYGYKTIVDGKIDTCLDAGTGTATGSPHMVSGFYGPATATLTSLKIYCDNGSFLTGTSLKVYGLYK